MAKIEPYAAKSAYDPPGYAQAVKVTDAQTMERICTGLSFFLHCNGLTQLHQQQPPQPGRVTHLIKVRVADVDAQFERARAYGARVLQEPTDYEYGERECTVEDLAGHRWQFTQSLRDVAPEKWGGVLVDP